VGGEGRPGGDDGAVGVAEVAQGDDVASAVIEVGRRAQDQSLPGGRDPGVGIQLGPERVSLAGVGVEDDDRGVRGEVARHIGDVVAAVEVAQLVLRSGAECLIGRGPGLVEVQAGDQRQHGLPG
jgi:hypothetical protein